MSSKRILILNGPNLNLIGKRNPEVYGTETFEEYYVQLTSEFKGEELVYFQSNVEGELINEIQEFDGEGIILNAGGFTHSSVAIRDAIEAVKTPVIEVHISNITAREEFRHTSLISPVCEGCVFGFGLVSYRLALGYFLL